MTGVFTGTDSLVLSTFPGMSFVAESTFTWVAMALPPIHINPIKARVSSCFLDFSLPLNICMHISPYIFSSL